LLIALLALTVAAACSGNAFQSSSPPPAIPLESVVVCSPGDPLFPLAQEIAAKEQLQLVNDLSEAFRPGVEAVLWVISPERLSDQAMIAAGKLQMKSGLQAALGIITGATLEEARQLWERQGSLSAKRSFAVNAQYPAAGVMEGRILQATAPLKTTNLTIDSLKQALRAADYLTFTGHGGGRSWSLEEGLSLRGADIPNLPPVVLSAASCQTFRPWVEGSIALAFVQKGAAAYAGFVFSPLEGYLLGEFDGLPFRFTSPGFTIGQVMQVQNRGTLRGFAPYPHYILLGDPRSSLNPFPPFQPDADENLPGGRVIHYSDLPPGVIPLRIKGGARYTYLETPQTALSDGDLFFNARVQMLPVGDDRLVLVDHPGGDVSLSLREHPPMGWNMLDAMIDSLDYTLIFLNHRDDVLVNLGAGLMALLAALWIILRRKLRGRWVLAAVLVGIAAAGLHAGYALLRHSAVTVNAKPDLYNPIAPLATLLLAGSAYIFCISARSRRGRLLGWVTALFPALAPFILTLGMVLVINTVALIQLGAPIYNFQILWGPLLAGGVVTVIALALLAITRPWLEKKEP
jgi:hypothetical protein